MGLTLYIGTAVLRKTVENRYPFEISFGDLFQRLRFRLEKKLDKTSQKILYPKGGNYTGDLSDLAMTTLYSILRFACNIPPHREGWGKRPLDDDRCLSANIERIRIMRNELMHRTNAEMNEQEYQNKFRILKRTLLDLGANEEDINAITLIPDDPHFAFGHSRKTRPNQRADESMKFWKKSSMHRKGLAIYLVKYEIFNRLLLKSENNIHLSKIILARVFNLIYFLFLSTSIF